MEGGAEQSRGVMLERISKARSQQEISDAGLQAQRYLEQYPDDTDVIVATEKLHRRGMKLADPPDEASWQQIVTYMGVALVLVLLPAAIMLAAGYSARDAWLVGVGLGALVFWELALVVAAGWESFGKKAVRSLKNRPRS